MTLCFSRWPFKQGEAEEAIKESVLTVNPNLILNNENITDSQLSLRKYFANWMPFSADNVVIVILLVALAIKFVFFEDRGDIAKQLKLKGESADAQKSVAEEGTVETMHTAAATLEGQTRRRFESAMPTMHSTIFPLSGMGGDWIEVEDESYLKLIDKEVQTDEINIISSTSGASNNVPEVPRTVEECLAIYRSEVSQYFDLFWNFNS